MDDIYNEANAALYIGVGVDVMQRYRAGEGVGPEYYTNPETGDALYLKSALDAWRQIYDAGAVEPSQEP